MRTSVGLFVAALTQVAVAAPYAAPRVALDLLTEARPAAATPALDLTNAAALEAPAIDAAAPRSVAFWAAIDLSLLASPTDEALGLLRDGLPPATESDDAWLTVALF